MRRLRILSVDGSWQKPRERSPTKRVVSAFGVERRTGRGNNDGESLRSTTMRSEPLLVGLGLLALACGPGQASSEETYTPSTYYAANASASDEYRRNVDGVGVYQGLYENVDAIRHYCGSGGTGVEPQVWQEACDRTLERVYWARVRTQYKFVDWQEVTDYCDLEPAKCDAPKGLDSAIRSSHISGAQRHNYQQAQQNEAEELARQAAQQHAQRKFREALFCPIIGMSDEAAGAECRGQRVVRCKAQMSVWGSAHHSGTLTTASAHGTAESACIETPARKD